jgi:pyridoxine 4-dehydrogenase
MIQQTTLGGRFTFPATPLTVHRMGYGAMQLAGREGNKLVWGPPKHVDGAIAVLREAVARGVNHIDTSDFYGPHVTNQIIRKALREPCKKCAEKIPTLCKNCRSRLTRAPSWTPHSVPDVADDVGKQLRNLFALAYSVPMFYLHASEL